MGHDAQMQTQMLKVTADRAPAVQACFRVDVLDSDDVAYWAAMFDVTGHEIQYAARSVGANVASVERFIRFTTAQRSLAPLA